MRGDGVKGGGRGEEAAVTVKATQLKHAAMRREVEREREREKERERERERRKRRKRRRGGGGKEEEEEDVGSDDRRGLQKATRHTAL